MKNTLRFFGAFIRGKRLLFLPGVFMSITDFFCRDLKRKWA